MTTIEEWNQIYAGYGLPFNQELHDRIRQESASELSALQKEIEHWKIRHKAATNEMIRSGEAYQEAIRSAPLTNEQRSHLAGYVGEYLQRGVHGVWHDLATGIAALIKDNDALRTQNRELREACVQFIAWYHVDPFKGDKHWKELPDIIRQAEQAIALQPEK